MPLDLLSTCRPKTFQGQSILLSGEDGALAWVRNGEDLALLIARLTDSSWGRGRVYGMKTLSAGTSPVEPAEDIAEAESAIEAGGAPSWAEMKAGRRARRPS